MRLAEKTNQRIPQLASVQEEGDFTTEKLNMLIQWMTKYNPKERISFRRVHGEMKAVNGKLPVMSDISKYIFYCKKL